MAFSVLHAMLSHCVDGAILGVKGIIIGKTSRDLIFTKIISMKFALNFSEV